MNGFVWCLSVIFVALVFGLVLCIAGGVLINIYFDVKKLRAAEASKESLETLMKALKQVKESAEALKGTDEDGSESVKKD
jgi:uncharacterized membrane protein YraQ (UPF0718 family)